MARVRVMGDMIQIKTDLTLNEIERVERFSPDTLKIKDKEGNELFGISVGDAHYSKYGIAFCNADASGKMFMTTSNPVMDHSDPVAERDAIKEEFAPIIKNLIEIETQVAAKQVEIRAMEQEADTAIVIDGESEE